jgi:hypothetical protein
MGWPSRASFERTDHMLVFMGSVSLVADHQQMFDFAPTASMVGSGEKPGTNVTPCVMNSLIMVISVLILHQIPWLIHFQAKPKEFQMGFQFKIFMGKSRNPKF